jgi:hypothetical protein
MRPLLYFLLLSAGCPAAPRVDDLAVVDLTAKAVRLVWNSGVDSRPEVDVFTNAAGTIPAPGIVTTPYSIFAGDSTAPNLATAEGMQEIEVTGLLPDTTYYLRARSVSVPAGTSATSGLVGIRTASTPLPALSAAAVTPFANPVLSLARVPSTEDYSSIATMLVVTTPGARAGVLALNSSTESWFVDLNGIISNTTGTPLPLTPGTPLEATLYTGESGARRFMLYAPDSDQLAEVRPPLLSPTTPVDSLITSPAPGLLLMEFPAAPGNYYAVESSATLGTGDWSTILDATRTETDRFFFSTNQLPDPTRFFRTRDVEVFPTP